MPAFAAANAPEMKQRIAQFYDQLSPHFRELWGPHLHDGYYANGARSKEEAQDHLVDVLAELADVSGEESVIDVGCGMGATSVALAKRGCRTHGVTLSEIQVGIAQALARDEGVAERTRFEVRDAETLVMPETYDLAWMVGVLGHLPDPRAFVLERANALLRPGGRFLLADWMLGPDVSQADRDRHVAPVLEGMLMPTAFTTAQARDWFEAAGFTVLAQRDFREETFKTWRDGVSIMQMGAVIKLAQSLGGDALRLIRAVHAMRHAMAHNFMTYGVLVLEKNGEASH